MTIRVGPCNWELAHCGEPSSGAPECSALGGLSTQMRTTVIDAAVGYLWNFSGRRFGSCPLTVRPCREECATGSTYRGPRESYSTLPWYGSFGGGTLNPALLAGEWFNLGCGSCRDRCSCSEVAQVDLPGPVAAISEVRLDGAILASSAYRVDNDRFLVRTDGGRWPTCQNMSANPMLDSDTFSVAYELGVSVPAGGQLAAGVLACELAKAACGDSGCQLPKRVQTITRQGVTMSFLDSFDSLFSRGATGLWAVDSWLASVNAVVRGGSRVTSPDVRPYRRTTS